MEDRANLNVLLDNCELCVSLFLNSRRLTAGLNKVTCYTHLCLYCPQPGVSLIRQTKNRAFMFGLSFLSDEQNCHIFCQVQYFIKISNRFDS